MYRKTLLDAVILITLVPVLPMLTFWWLPWERWIPRALPKIVIGPYLMYCAFAAWYFNLPVWFAWCVAIWGLIVAAMGVRERTHTSTRST